MKKGTAVHLLLSLAALLVAPLAVAATAEEPAQLTVEEALKLGGLIRAKYARCLDWLDGGAYIAEGEPDGKEAKTGLRVVDAQSGDARAFFAHEQMAAALAALPGVSEEEARAWSSGLGGDLLPDKSGLLLQHKNDLFCYRFGETTARRLTSDPRAEECVAVSPDGALVAFVKDHNLHVVGSDGSAERALTEEGGAERFCGQLDWVYQEEVYGRGQWRAHWWSPDSKHLAFLALDVSREPEHTVADDRQLRPALETWRYPRAGDPNPRVQVGVVNAGGGDVRWVDLSRYESEEFLVVRVGWTPDSSQVIVQVQDRVQTWIDVVAVDRRSGAASVLFRDRTSVWIEPSEAPFWTADGAQFLWLSSRDGYRHLYLYQRDGKLARRLTEGPFDVLEVHGIDAARGLVYFSANRDDAKGRKLFQVALDGSGLQAVTSADGSHAVSFSPTFEFFIDEYSALRQPGRAVLCRGDGSLVRVLGEGTSAPLDKYGLNAPEFVKVKTRDGFEMEALLIKPRDYDPARRYPVLSYTYAGPSSPSVSDRFGGGASLWHQVLAQQGYLIWVCDNRSASGKGLQSAAGAYRRLGAQELLDLEDGIDWLVAEGYADPERVGIWGWSYGGFMTCYALTHSKKFKIGIAVAPVTDWRLYDSIYTERYMDTPQRNAEGYDASSAVKAAANLHGRLLLIHGTMDENVHLQNTLQLARALQDAGKRFDLMLYPGNRHGVGEPRQRAHLYELMTRFVLENL
ncbi:MAG: S9 family peptidase [Planctomycetes bacterium]|nr:S9 family peptidase [Planctomycetota bacterium]